MELGFVLGTETTILALLFLVGVDLLLPNFLQLPYPKMLSIPMDNHFIYLMGGATTLNASLVGMLTANWVLLVG